MPSKPLRTHDVKGSLHFFHFGVSYLWKLFYTPTSKLLSSFIDVHLT